MERLAFETMTRPEVEWLMAAFGHRLSPLQRERVSLRLDGLWWDDEGEPAYVVERFARNAVDQLRQWAVRESVEEPRFSRREAERLLVAIDALLES